MAHVTAVADTDRLPWLADEARRAPLKARGDGRLLFGWAVAATLLVAGASYWLGRSVTEGEAAQPRSAPAATIRLPGPALPEANAPAEPIESPMMPQVAPATSPRQVAITPARDVRPAPQRSLSVSNPAEPESVAGEDAGEGAEGPDAAAAAERPLSYWPASESAGASGRVVRIGTFSTRRQAKRAWWRIVGVYPGMQSLKAVVAPAPSSRDGRTYYRLQFGTTSQAHSEILCQRMRIVGQSCVVIGVERKAG